MAAKSSLVEKELDKFRSYNSRLKKSVFQDNEEHRKAINLLLDDFNSIEYSLRILGQEVKAGPKVMTAHQKCPLCLHVLLGFSHQGCKCDWLLCFSFVSVVFELTNA